MSVGIGRVIEAAATRRPAPEWVAAAERIAVERDAVERFLDEGGRAYGFSTRLGHLDLLKAIVNQNCNSHSLKHVHVVSLLDTDASHSRSSG